MLVSLLEIVLVLAAGFAAGMINAIIGSGTLITFPVLLAVGYPPVIANVTNTFGLLPGSAAAVWAYRPELRGTRARVLRFAPASFAGAALGAALLLLLPADAFRVIVVPLIVLAVVLVLLQPQISAWVAARRTEDLPHGGRGLLAGIFGTGIYGGYFGAAQGVLLFALLATSLRGRLQEVNAIRALLAGVANGVAAVIFLFVAKIAFLPALLIAASSTVGGLLGAGIGRRLPDRALRAVIVLVGVAAIVQIVL